MKTKDFLLGVGAGAAIALGGILNLICKAYLTGDLAIAAKILGSFLFPVGLITVLSLIEHNVFHLILPILTSIRKSLKDMYCEKNEILKIQRKRNMSH